MNTAFRMLLESAGSTSESAIDRLQGLPDASAQLSDPDYWGSVGIMALTGILVVFLILAILIFFFWLMGTIFKAIDKSKAVKKASAEAAKKTEVPVVETETVSEAPQDDEEEIVAAISAAIAAYEGEGNFTIRSIRKRGDASAHTRSAWSMAGLSGNMREF